MNQGKSSFVLKRQNFRREIRQQELNRLFQQKRQSLLADQFNPKNHSANSTHSKEQLFTFDQKVNWHHVHSLIRQAQISHFDHKSVDAFLTYMISVLPGSCLDEGRLEEFKKQINQEGFSMAKVFKCMKECFEKLLSFEFQKYIEPRELHKLYGMGYYFMKQMLKTMIRTEELNTLKYYKLTKQLELSEDRSADQKQKALNTFMRDHPSCFEEVFREVLDIVCMHNEFLYSKIYESVPCTGTNSFLARNPPESLYCLWKYLSLIDHEYISDIILKTVLQQIENCPDVDANNYEIIDISTSAFMNLTQHCSNHRITEGNQLSSKTHTKYSLETVADLVFILSKCLENYELGFVSVRDICVTVRNLMESYGEPFLEILSGTHCITELLEFMKDQKRQQKKLQAFKADLDNNKPCFGQNLTFQEQIDKIDIETQVYVYEVINRFFGFLSCNANQLLKKFFDDNRSIICSLIAYELGCFNRTIFNARIKSEMMPEGVQSLDLSENFRPFISLLSNLVATSSLIAELFLQEGVFENVLKMSYYLGSDEKKETFYVIYNFVIQSDSIMFETIAELFNKVHKEYFEAANPFSMLPWLNRIFREAVYSKGYSDFKPLKINMLRLYQPLLKYLALTESPTLRQCMTENQPGFDLLQGDLKEAEELLCSELYTGMNPETEEQAQKQLELLQSVKKQFSPKQLLQRQNYTEDLEI